jgi:hypothetical protein
MHSAQRPARARAPRQPHGRKAVVRLRSAEIAKAVADERAAFASSRHAVGGEGRPPSARSLGGMPRPWRARNCLNPKVHRPTYLGATYSDLRSSSRGVPACLD